MATNLTRLNVALTATLGPFAQAMKGAEGLATRFGTSIKSALLAPLTQLSGLLTAGAIVNGLKNAADRIDRLAKSADRLGLSTQALAGLQLAAQQTGSSAETMSGALEKMTKLIADAASGSREAQRHLHEIGLTLDDLKGKTPDEQFLRIAQAIRELRTQGEKTSATMSIFGKGSADLVNTIDEGAEGFDYAASRARELGLAVSRLDAAKVEELNDRVEDLGKTMDGILNRALVEMAPLASEVAKQFEEGARAAAGLSEEGTVLGQIGQKVLAYWLQATEMAAKLGVEATIIWGEAAEDFGNLGDTIARVAQWIGTKLMQALDLVTAGLNTIAAAMVSTWEHAKIPIASFVQFVGEKAATVLRVMGETTSRVDAAAGAAMIAAAGEVAAATGGMAVDARTNAEAAGKALTQVAAQTVDATKALFSEVTTSGSQAMRDLAEWGRQYQSQQNLVLREFSVSDDQGAALQTTIDRVNAEAEVRNQARANEIAADQEAQAKITATQGEHVRTRAEEYAEWRENIERDQQAYWSNTLSGQQAFWNNLASLQQSHNRTAQRIGKAAAKVSIVVNTAQAAMAGYNNGMEAGGPYAGPYLAALYMAAAIAAGVVQLANVDKSDSGTLGGASAPSSPSSSMKGGGGGKDTSNRQTLVLEGSFISSDAIVDLYKEAKERGIVIDEVRRG